MYLRVSFHKKKIQLKYQGKQQKFQIIREIIQKRLIRFIPYSH